MEISLSSVWVGQFKGHEYGNFQRSYMVFSMDLSKLFHGSKPWKNLEILPQICFGKPVKMLWIYHEKFNRIFMCFDFVVPAFQDFDCSLPTLPSLFQLLIRVMGAWMPWMGAYGWVTWGLFTMETVQWTSVQSGHPPDQDKCPLNGGWAGVR